MATHTVFYSWQSDRPNSTNRGFIENCLERAINEIRSDDDLEIDPCLERDTAGVPGSPDIAATIFEKIRRSHVFVADVTFIDDEGDRRTPNPNVLVELGYAAGCLGWDRVICVFNEAHGPIIDLPFDLRPRRIRSYLLNAGQEKAEARNALVSALRADITSILHAPDEKEHAEFQELLSSVASELISVIVFGEEIEERSINPWLNNVMSRFKMSADSLRGLAVSDSAIAHSLFQELIELADLLDQAGNHRMHLGSWPEFTLVVQQAVDKAKTIKATRIDSVQLSEESLAEVRRMIQATSRKLAQLSDRAGNLAEQGRWEEVQEESSEFGQTLLRLSHYRIDSIKPGLSEELSTIGRDLHLIETMPVYCDGGRSVTAIVERACNDAQTLSTLANSLRPNN